VSIQCLVAVRVERSTSENTERKWMNNSFLIGAMRADISRSEIYQTGFGRAYHFLTAVRGDKYQDGIF